MTKRECAVIMEYTSTGIFISMTKEQAKDILKGNKMQIKYHDGKEEKGSADSTELHKVSSRPKSEQYVCISCGEFCYYPHSKNGIQYRFCPNCGRKVRCVV